MIELDDTSKMLQNSELVDPADLRHSLPVWGETKAKQETLGAQSAFNSAGISRFLPSKSFSPPVYILLLKRSPPKRLSSLGQVGRYADLRARRHTMDNENCSVNLFTRAVC